MLSDVIGDSDGSRFYWALVDNAIAEDADFGFYPHDACGSFYIALTTDPGAHRAGAEYRPGRTGEGQERTLTRMKSSGPRTRSPAVWCSQGEVPLGRMRSIGGQWIYNKQYRSLEMDMATLSAVTRDSLHDLMRDFPFDPMTIVTLGPGEKAEEK